ncbi:mutator type transposase [Tanacetum coccineum]
MDKKMKKTRILTRLYGVTSTTVLRHNIFKARHVSQQHYGVTTRKDYAVTLLIWKAESSESALRRNVDTRLRSVPRGEQGLHCSKNSTRSPREIKLIILLYLIIHKPHLVSKDAVLLRVFPFTLTGSAKRWVNRLPPRAVNTWDLLKKAFIQRYCPPSKTAKQLEDIHNFKQESDESLYQAWEWTTNGAPSSSTGQCKVVDADHETPHRPISLSKLKNLHIVSHVQVAQNEEERTTDVLQCQLPPKELNIENFTLPCTIGNFNFYGMADLGASVNVMPRNIFEYLRLANLRNTNILVEMADMMNKEPLDNNSRINNDRVSYDMEKKDHNFTTPIEKIFMIKSDLDNRPQSLACSNNQSRNLRDRSPGDSLHNQGSKKKKIKLDQHTLRAHFCKPIKHTVNKNTMATRHPQKVCVDGEQYITGSLSGRNLRFWYCNYNNERKNITGIGLSFPDYLLAKYEKYQTDSLVWDDRYAEWCNVSPTPGTSSQESKNPIPRDYTFREWTLIKVGHTDISEPVKKALLKLWLIDCFLDESGIIKNPLSRSFHDYKWVFDLEIEQLADEYELGMGKKDICLIRYENIVKMSIEIAHIGGMTMDL